MVFICFKLLKVNATTTAATITCLKKSSRRWLELGAWQWQMHTYNVVSNHFNILFKDSLDFSHFLTLSYTLFYSLFCSLFYPTSSNVHYKEITNLLQMIWKVKNFDIDDDDGWCYFSSVAALFFSRNENSARMVKKQSSASSSDFKSMLS